MAINLKLLRPRINNFYFPADNQVTMAPYEASPLKPVSNALSCLAVLLALLGIFSVPFPFVRNLWVQEIWGISGFINAMIFLFMSYEIERFSIAAALAGIGLTLHEMILATRGFLYLTRLGKVDTRDILFLAGSFFLCLILLGVFFYSFKRTYHHQKRIAAQKNSENPHTVNSYEGGFQYLIASLFGYFLAFAVIYKSLSLQHRIGYGTFKTIGAFVSVGAFVGIGLEIQRYIEIRQTKLYCLVKVASHFIALAAVLWAVYKLIPLSDVIS